MEWTITHNKYGTWVTVRAEHYVKEQGVNGPEHVFYDLLELPNEDFKRRWIKATANAEHNTVHPV